MDRIIVIRVPASSANIGPGFDVIGLALNLFLELTVTIAPPHVRNASKLSPHCQLSYRGEDKVSLDPEINLITRVALYVLRCHGQKTFPTRTHIQISNSIPIGRGLGSSGAAVVGGVALANELGNLGLSKARMLDYCLMVERHPDNVAAALYGGFVGTYLNELDPTEASRLEVPLSEVLPELAGGVDTGLQPPSPPLNIGHYHKFKWAKEIKCIAIIPQFEVPTVNARKVLPDKYSRSDVVYNLQRIALLPSALGESPPDPESIFLAMQDKLHHPYRKTLIPGLTEILQSVTPKSHPGLLGVCLSGAGPTILALATKNFNEISNFLIEQFKRESIECKYELLEPAEDGMTVKCISGTSKTSQLTCLDRLTYSSAGVSIDAGNELVQRIKPLLSSTTRPGADCDIGGFGGILDLQAAGYNLPPVLVQAIDGIGTKLKVAIETGDHSTVGIDLVAMNVNDLVVQGAEPLSFLDYFATSHLDIDNAVSLMQGIANGCRQAGCALIGGETAEMPGMYSAHDYDAGGCATGAIRHGQKVLPDINAMEEGDILLGLESSGPHSNGYSLIRKIIDREKLAYSDVAPWDSRQTVGESLLTPTKIYVKPLLAAIEKSLLKGMAHITGGGLYDNIPRMLPNHLAAMLDCRTWPVPAVLMWLKNKGRVENSEFARTWNTGLGMVLVLEPLKVRETVDVLRGMGQKVHKIGRLVSRGPGQSGCLLNHVNIWEEDVVVG